MSNHSETYSVKRLLDALDGQISAKLTPYFTSVNRLNDLKQDADLLEYFKCIPAETAENYSRRLAAPQLEMDYLKLVAEYNILQKRREIEPEQKSIIPGYVIGAISGISLGFVAALAAPGLLGIATGIVAGFMCMAMVTVIAGAIVNSIVDSKLSQQQDDIKVIYKKIDALPYCKHLFHLVKSYEDAEKSCQQQQDFIQSPELHLALKLHQAVCEAHSLGIIMIESNFPIQDRFYSDLLDRESPQHAQALQAAQQLLGTLSREHPRLRQISNVVSIDKFAPQP